MIVYIVVFRDRELNSNSKVSLMIALQDLWDPSNSDEDEKASTTVIIVAVLVGGIISAICIGIIVYLVVKTVKKDKDDN